jgi:AP-1 complex subunit gamma-1
MIRAIRACKTAAEERAVVRKECADIRALINEDDPHDRHRNLAKLMFIHMLGYPTHFGQMECLKLIASPGFPEKRIGYLGLMLLLDERQEVLMLVTNSLKQDLNHSNQYVVGLALCALGNICSAEMARDLAPEVERLIQFRDPNIRKKAALCSTRIIRKVPDLAENFVNAAASLLKEKHHGVLITGVQLCYELCTINDEALEYFRTKCTEGLIKTLRDITNSAYQPEYDVAGITDPFLHIRLLRLLRVLGQGDADASDLMTDILAQVATKTESNKNAGNAVLYECVETIMAIEDTNSLRVLAINILGRFLSNRDNNIRFNPLHLNFI